MILVFLLYPSITQTIFRYFQVRTFDGDYGSYLIADYAVNTASAFYVSVTPFAYTMIVVWPIGVPVTIVLLLWRNRGPLLEIRRREHLLNGPVYTPEAWDKYRETEKRTRRMSQQQLQASNDVDTAVEGYLWSLTEAYRGSVFYFEVIEYLSLIHI